jgi:hypothetical protein
LPVLWRLQMPMQIKPALWPDPSPASVAGSNPMDTIRN